MKKHDTGMGTLGQEGEDQQEARKGRRKRKRKPVDSYHGAVILSKKKPGSSRPRKKRKTRPAISVIDADFHLPMIQRA